jgi:phosphatidylserine/phosphatidylglycerophosphate/cardiolipin synthase-like enzyme
MDDDGSLTAWRVDSCCDERMAAIDVTFLRDVEHGGAVGQAQTVAQRLAAFVAAARVSVDVAIYDFRLSDALAGPVVGALIGAAARGVQVRIAYDAGKPTDAAPDTFAGLGSDPAPPGTAEWVTGHFAGTAVATKPITAPTGQLMHSKYVVRDVGHRSPSVWTGSTNFTDDAWNLQENNILVVPSAKVATSYRADFEQLWDAGSIVATGSGDAGSTTVSRVKVAWDFAPADGTGIDAFLTARVAAAAHRIVLATMVLTSHPLLAAMAAAIDRGVPVSGIYDAGQMGPIAKGWAKHPTDATVLANWKAVEAHLVGKKSTPYTPAGPHDFMHNKILIADNELVTGSYNLSANAQRNAENQLHIQNTALADRYAEYVGTIAADYRGA